MYSMFRSQTHMSGGGGVKIWGVFKRYRKGVGALCETSNRCENFYPGKSPLGGPKN